MFRCLPRRQAIVELAAFFGLVWLFTIFQPDIPILDHRPHPFWIPVLLLSLQYGTVDGIAAAFSSIAAVYLLDWPTQEIGEDYFEFWLRAWLEPSLWIAAALTIGTLRQSQVSEKTQLENDLRRTHLKATTLADATIGLRDRIDRLERQITAGGLVSHEAFAVIEAFYESTREDLEERLRGFIPALLGDVDWSLYLERQDLRLSFSSLSTLTVGVDESAFGNIVDALEIEGGVLAAHRSDGAMLGKDGIVFAVPLRNRGSGRVEGMLAIHRLRSDGGGADIELALLPLVRAIVWVVDHLWTAAPQAVPPTSAGAAQ